MISKVYPLGSRESYRYVVIFARHQGKWIFVRHRARDTWEQPGGHIEPGETPEAAAKRELWEETGASDFDIWPAFDYWAADEASESFGAVFAAEVRTLGELPPLEIAERRMWDDLPEKLTYPGITPLLFSEIERQAIYTRAPRAV